MMADNMRWVGTWTTTPAPAEGVAFANQTFRMNARASIGGDRLRVRLSNAYGSRARFSSVQPIWACAMRAQGWCRGQTKD